MKTYQRKTYELANQLSSQISDFNKSIDTPEKYGNAVYFILKKSGKTDAKEICLKNSNVIFNAFLMGEKTPAELAREIN